MSRDQTPSRVRDLFPTVSENFAGEAHRLIEQEEVDTREPDTMQSFDGNIDEFPEWVGGYLRGQKDDEYHRAHQFTVNHVTYPLVRDQHFAAVPYVPPLSNSSGVISKQMVKRQVEIFAGLATVEPGDLMFFYKSDAQQESTSDYDAYENSLERNRGLLGVYRALSESFVDPCSVSHPKTGYTLAGACEDCGSLFSFMRGDKESPDGSVPRYWCPGSSLYEHDHHQNDYLRSGSLQLAARIDLEPLVTFELPVVDNSAYGNLEGGTIIWTGRADNMPGGWGKGSTIRHLLPEEAEKLTRLLTEQATSLDPLLDDGQSAAYTQETVDYPGIRGVLPMVHHTGVPLDYPEVDGESGSWVVFQENILFLQMSRLVREVSPFTKVLAEMDNRGAGDLVSDLEFYSWEFPWGYANDQCDFLCIYCNGKRARGFLFENKVRKANNAALAELMLYVPWVAKAITRFTHDAPKDFRLTPVLVANDTTRNLHLTEPMTVKANNIGGESISVEVDGAQMITYQISDEEVFEVDGSHFAEQLHFKNITNRFSSSPWSSALSTLSATDKEMSWVKDRWPFRF